MPNLFPREELQQSFVFKDFPSIRAMGRLFNFASVRHMTRRPEFFGAIPRTFRRLEADRDHDGT
jgi:hypothetical protein